VFDVAQQPDRAGKRLIFVASITTKSGRVIYASQFGKKAFPIWV